MSWTENESMRTKQPQSSSANNAGQKHWNNAPRLLRASSQLGAHLQLRLLCAGPWPPRRPHHSLCQTVINSREGHRGQWVSKRHGGKPVACWGVCSLTCREEGGSLQREQREQTDGSPSPSWVVPERAKQGNKLGCGTSAHAPSCLLSKMSAGNLMTIKS